MKFYQIAEKVGGKLNFSAQNWNSLVERLFDGRYLVTLQRLDPRADLKDYHRLYFAKLDALADETGHTKAEMHELVKENVLAVFIADLPELYTQPEFRTGPSTLGLGREGWVVFIERFELWAFSEYGIILR